MKLLNVSGGPGGERFFDDASTAALTFTDRVSIVTAQQMRDANGAVTLMNLNFVYSKKKKGNVYGAASCTEICTKLTPLELHDDERIDQVIVYEDYRKIDNLYRLDRSTYLVVGIDLHTTAGQQRSYGAINGTKKVFVEDGYFLGYVQGKAGGFIDNLRLIFYKYCLKNSSSLACTQ